jgi:uncharacterized protein YjlB
MPNNERLPVLIYPGTFKAAGDNPASIFEQALEGNRWPPQWRNGVYDFHHYHSTAHQVLGFARGQARLIMLGGDGGHEITVLAGDVAVPPTETGHCNLGRSEDFLVAGALSSRSALGHLPKCALRFRSGTHAAAPVSGL